MGAEKICNVLKQLEEAGDVERNAGMIQSSSISVDLSLPLPAMIPPLIELCKDLFKKWSKLDDSCFSVETVSGGITNLLLKVSVKEESGNDVSVTVRLYGPNTDYVINRERELQSSESNYLLCEGGPDSTEKRANCLGWDLVTFKILIFDWTYCCLLEDAIKYLSAAGFGAKLLGVFRNGMVQSFINARTLTPSDMRKPKLAAEIAKQLCKFHQVQIPGSKEPQLWNDIFKFYEKASALQFDDSGKQSTYDTISFKEIHKEILEIKELTGLLNSPIVFAHNDLLSGNLMLNDEEERLYLIDFEYGSYSYRGFDIGNHFNEYAGYDCDYSLYPSKEEQYHFFRHYLQPEKPEEVSQKDLESLYIESNTFMLASHLYWALWAVIQARMSPIDFDYLGYFFLRYGEFKRQKEKYCYLARSFLAGSGSGSGSGSGPA